jgi:hypothetical protein
VGLDRYFASAGCETVGESKYDLSQINVRHCAHVCGKHVKAYVITVDEIHDHSGCSLTLIQSQVLSEDHHARVLIGLEVKPWGDTVNSEWVSRL